jgi:DNA-binding SARP family transcriptional activator/tetratricopeptide (TPR) repeat protein
MSEKQAQQDPSPKEGLYVRLFGGPILLRDGVEVPLSAYQSHLLGLIYGSGSAGISREEAAWLLWESEDSPAARHRVSQLLYSIRRRIGGPLAEGHPPSALRGSIQSDLGDVLRALREGQTPDPQLLESHYLSLSDPPTAEMGHWVDAKRTTVVTQLRGLLKEQLASARSQRHLPRIRELATILISIDSSDEAALQLLIETLALAGDQHLIDAEIQAHAHRYHSRTGSTWIPSAGTQSALQQIDRLDNVRNREPTPFFGREAELQSLLRTLSSACAEPHFTILCGAAGIGKTRLAKESLKHLVLQGYLTLECKSSPVRRDIPLDGLLNGISHPSILPLVNRLEDPWRSSLTRLLPQVDLTANAPLPLLDPQSSARRLMESLYQIIRLASSTAPAVLFLDDLQWVDRTTLAFLEFVTARVPSLGIHVLITLRDDAVCEEHVSSFVELARDTATWVRLGPLDEASADALLDAAAPLTLNAGDRQRLRVATGHNPFFLIELANDYTPKDPGANARVPESIRQLIAVRMNLLPTIARTLLQYLSIVESVDVTEGSGLKSLSPTELVDAADDLLRARMIEHRSGRILIQHDLIRQAVYELMGPIKRAVLHKDAAIAALSDSQHGLAAAAIHFDGAGAHEEAFRTSMQAGASAEGLGAVRDAVEFYELARRNAGTLSERRASWGALAKLLYESRRLEQAAVVLKEAMALGDSPEQFQLMLLDCQSELPGARQSEYLHDVDAIRSAAMAAQKWKLYTECIEVRLRMLERAGQLDDIRCQLAEVKAIRDSIESSDPELECSLNLILALSLFYSDDDVGLDAATAAVRLAEDYGLHSRTLRAYNRLLLCYGCRAELHSANATNIVRAALRLAEVGGDIRSRVTIYNNVGVYYMDTRRLLEARDYFSAALRLVCGASEHAMVLVNWGEWHYWDRNLEVAEQSFREAVQHGQRQPIFPMISVQTSAGLGLCALARGQMTAACAYEAQVRTALQTWVHEPILLVRFLAELERRRGRVDRAIAIIREETAKARQVLQVIRGKALEAEYLRATDRRAADRVMAEAAELAGSKGLAHMLLD